MKITLSKMGKIYYYYDPKIKRGGTHYFTDYYCTNGRKKVWAGEISRDTQTGVLKSIRHIVNVLNKPRPLFGQCSLLTKWMWWMKALKNK